MSTEGISLKRGEMRIGAEVEEKTLIDREEIMNKELNGVVLFFG